MGVKWLGRNIDHPFASSAQIKVQSCSSALSHPRSLHTFMAHYRVHFEFIQKLPFNTELIKIRKFKHFVSSYAAFFPGINLILKFDFPLCGCLLFLLIM